MREFLAGTSVLRGSSKFTAMVRKIHVKQSTVLAYSQGHALMAAGPWTWRSRCGCHGKVRFIGLAKQCPGRPSGSAYKQIRERLCDGRHPRTGEKLFHNRELAAGCRWRVVVGDLVFTQDTDQRCSASMQLRLRVVLPQTPQLSTMRRGRRFSMTSNTVVRRKQSS